MRFTTDIPTIMTILKVFNLEDKFESPIDRLSGGQIQKLILIKMFMQERPLNLLCDGFSSLDIESVKIFQNLLSIQKCRFLSFVNNPLLTKSPADDSQIHHQSEVNWGTPRDQELIKIEELSFGYKSNTSCVLSNVNLTVRSGELVKIVGGNGKGKSTIAKIISGLYQPSKGQIISTASQIRLLPQSHTRSYFEKDVASELKLNAKLQGENPNHNTPLIATALKDVELSSDRMTEDLNSRELFRLSIVSTSIGADLLILDEPECQTENDILWLTKYLQSITARGMGVILITHIPAINRGGYSAIHYLDQRAPAVS
jgi:ABC-type Mn2+/Zn2+ transport system ATPase subunit